jgi:hypothetical protein
MCVCVCVYVCVQVVWSNLYSKTAGVTKFRMLQPVDAYAGASAAYASASQTVAFPQPSDARRPTADDDEAILYADYKRNLLFTGE